MKPQWQGFGKQPFDPGVTLKEIAECLEKWDCKNVQFFNSLTNDLGSGYIFAPYNGLSGPGMEEEKVREMWKWIQTMDQAAYNSINWLLIGKMTLLIIPPPPPPPGDDD